MNKIGWSIKSDCLGLPQLEGIVVESTFNWYWLVDGFMDQGHRVHLADTASIQQYEALKYTKNNQRAGSGPPPAICL